MPVLRHGAEYMLSEPRAYVVRAAPILATAPGHLYGDDSEQRVVGLARALVASPPWQCLPGAVMVARPRPTPLLGVVGQLDPAGRARVEALSWQPGDALARLRYLGYADVQEATERLAAQLTVRLGGDTLDRAGFVAIPRGGHVVLGMLSYLLRLRPEKLSGPIDGGLTVVVDDCALSGSRLRRFLRHSCPGDVVFAPLLSTPELRHAAEQDERVVACVSGDDLIDHARWRFGDDYSDWHARWRRRSPDDYWTGHPDHVCFPWNEPDVAIWNAATNDQEPGWRVVPPELCLKNRLPAGADARLQVQREGPGPLRATADVLAADLDGDAIVARVGDDTAVRLSGTAAAMWRALLVTGTAAGGVAQLAEHYAVANDVLASDVESFARSLMERGLLEG